MKDVYEICHVLEDDQYSLRMVEEGDADDLLKVYSDRNAVQFFNSDNCNGDDFYYESLQRM